MKALRRALPLVLTDDGWSVFTLLVFSLFAAYNTGTNLIFLLAATLLATLIVSAIASHVSVSAIAVTVFAPPVADEQIPITVTIVVRNDGTSPARFIRAAIRFCDVLHNESEQLDGEESFIPVLHPGEERRLSVRIRFPMRGKYRLQPVSIESTFPLGLVTWPHRAVEHTVQTTVVPSLLATAFHGVSSHEQETPADFSKTFVRGEGMTFYGLRRYSPGDPLKRVHWKSTARTGTLMVKEFQRNLTARYYVYLDLDEARLVGSGPTANLEYSIRLCATLCHQLSRENNLTQVLIFQDDVLLSPPVFTASDAYLMLRFLGAASYGSSADLPRLVERTRPAIVPGSFLVFILVDLDRRLTEQIMQSTVSSQRAIAMLVCRDEAHLAALRASPHTASLEQAGVRTMFFDHSKEESLLDSDGGSLG